MGLGTSSVHGDVAVHCVSEWAVLLLLSLLLCHLLGSDCLKRDADQAVGKALADLPCHPHGMSLVTINLLDTQGTWGVNGDPIWGRKGRTGAGEWDGSTRWRLLLNGCARCWMRQRAGHVQALHAG